MVTFINSAKKCGINTFCGEYAIYIIGSLGIDASARRYACRRLQGTCENFKGL